MIDHDMLVFLCFFAIANLIFYIEHRYQTRMIRRHLDELPSLRKRPAMPEERGL